MLKQGKLKEKCVCTLLPIPHPPPTPPPPNSAINHRASDNYRPISIRCKLIIETNEGNIDLIPALPLLLLLLILFSPLTVKYLLTRDIRNLQQSCGGQIYTLQMYRCVVRLTYIYIHVRIDDSGLSLPIMIYKLWVFWEMATQEKPDMLSN